MIETPSAALQQRLPSLTGMRFLAAMLVFLSHIAGYRIFASESLDQALSDHVTQLGGVGVSFFFMLSGFVLTWTVRGGDTPVRFIRRRLVKIFPNHLVTGLVGAALLLAAGSATMLSMVPSLFLLQAWVPIETITFVPNDPSWSLCVELLFYLCFPWLLPRVMRIPVHRLRAVAVALVLTSALIAVAAQLLPDQPEITWFGGTQSWWEYWFVYILPISRMPEFVLGMVAARCVAEGRAPRIGLLGSAALLLPAYAVTVLAPGVYGLIAPTMIPLALVICAGATADLEHRWAPMAGRRMVWLGEVSFAFYLVHVLAIQFGPLQARGYAAEWDPATGLALAGVTLLLSVVLGWLLFRVVEQPAVRRWSSARGMVRSSPDVHSVER